MNTTKKELISVRNKKRDNFSKAYEMCARERDFLDVILYLFIVFSNLLIYAT